MSRQATARLFVAIDPPAHALEELAEWARSAAAALGGGSGGRRAGWPLRLLDSDALHLTLCFLGNRPVAEIDAISLALNAWGTAIDELSVGAPLWLPPRRPRALAVEVHDHDDQLARLHDSLSDAISQVSGWEPRRGRFRAHITLARMRVSARTASERTGPEAILPPTPQLSFMPASIALYRSWLSPEGARYETVARCSLSAAAR